MKVRISVEGLPPVVIDLPNEKYTQQALRKCTEKICKDDLLQLGAQVKHWGISLRRGSEGEYFSAPNLQPPYTMVYMDHGQEVESGRSVDILMYQEGYVLSVGTSYVKCIREKNVRFAANKSFAHIFPSMKSVRDFIKRHEHVLRLMKADERWKGESFGFEAANHFFEEDEEVRMQALTPRQRNNKAVEKQKLKALLDELNSYNTVK